MKWCRFQVGDKVRYGIVEDEARVIGSCTCSLRCAVKHNGEM